MIYMAITDKEFLRKSKKILSKKRLDLSSDEDLSISIEEHLFV